VEPRVFVDAMEKRKSLVPSRNRTPFFGPLTEILFPDINHWIVMETNCVPCEARIELLKEV
jgi:hypothetical protein